MSQTEAQVRPVPNRSAMARVQEAADRFEEATPQEVIGWAFEEYGEGVAIATGFGSEGVAMIDMAARINPRPTVFFLDTGFLFKETHDLRRRLEDRYRIEIFAFQPQLTPEAQEQLYQPRLWATDPDLCCRLRKVEPLKRALAGRAAWMTAIRRGQTAARASARAVEWDHMWRLVKVNPLVRWTKRDVWNYIVKNDVPYNPLHDAGYPSIGCEQCTRVVRIGEDDRAGRWAGFSKTECGLHAASEVTNSHKEAQKTQGQAEAASCFYPPRRSGIEDFVGNAS